MRTLLVIGVLAAAVLVGASSASAVASFVTPARTVYCGLSEGEGPLRLICWRPYDGLTLDVGRFGRAQGRIYLPNRGFYQPVPGHVLRYGETWRRPGYWRCASRSTGLTCTNRAGHGWWLGRRRSRLF